MKSGVIWSDVSAKGVDAGAELPSSTSLALSGGNVLSRYAMTTVASGLLTKRGQTFVLDSMLSSPNFGGETIYAAAAARARIVGHIPDLFIERNDWNEMHVVRLSDPEQSSAVAGHIAELAGSKEMALKFLENIGVATADGRLAKAFGG